MQDSGCHEKHEVLFSFMNASPQGGMNEASALLWCGF